MPNSIVVETLTPELAERIFALIVTRPKGCWEWQGNKDSSGYGQIAVLGKTHHITRLVYAIVYRVDPGEMHVLHRCDNPACVRPSHLFLGTHRDNMNDRGLKGRTWRPRSEFNPTRKLTREQVLAIRNEYAMGDVFQAELGKKYGVGQSQIGRIVRGLSWPDVGGPIIE